MTEPYTDDELEFMRISAHKFHTSPSPENTLRLLDEIAALRVALERARTYTGAEGYPCPLCQYDNGEFIALCTPHQQLEAAVAELERERDDG